MNTEIEEADVTNVRPMGECCMTCCCTKARVSKHMSPVLKLVLQLELKTSRLVEMTEV